VRHGATRAAAGGTRTARPATPVVVLEPSFVMPALVAGIHDLKAVKSKDVDGRNKSGHDE
jgi:hypothetical protein